MNILKIKPWLLFVVHSGLFIFILFVFILSVVLLDRTFLESAILVDFIVFTMIWAAAVYYWWCYSFLRRHVFGDQLSSTRKTSIYMALVFSVIAVLIIAIYSLGRENAYMLGIFEEYGDLLSTITAFGNLANIYLSFCISVSIAKWEYRKIGGKVIFWDYIGTMIAILYFPIGLWWAQPKVNAM